MPVSASSWDYLGQTQKYFNVSKSFLNLNVYLSSYREWNGNFQWLLNTLSPVKAEAGPLFNAVADKIYYDTFNSNAYIFHRLRILRILLFSYAITLHSTEKTLITQMDYSFSLFFKCMNNLPLHWLLSNTFRVNFINCHQILINYFLLKWFYRIVKLMGFGELSTHP